MSPPVEDGTGCFGFWGLSAVSGVQCESHASVAPHMEQSLGHCLQLDTWLLGCSCTRRQEWGRVGSGYSHRGAAVLYIAAA